MPTPLSERLSASALPLAAQLLEQLHPATGVVHVGTGQGLGAIHQWRQYAPEQALLIDAAGEQAPWLEEALASHPGWRYLDAVVAADEGPLEFYTASNPAESGTLQPSSLQSLWPSLRTQQQQTRSAQTLDALVSAHKPGWQPDWLLVDCLPALPVLQGACTILPHCNVVWVRTTLDATLPASTRLDEIQSFLQRHHFKPLVVAEALNPALCEAIFVRDMAWTLQQVREQAEIAQKMLSVNASAHEQQTQVANKTIVDLQTENAQLAKENADAQAHRDVLAKELDQLFETRYSLASEIQQLIAQRDAEARAKASALAERDAQAHLAAERQAALAAANTANDALQSQVFALKQNAQNATKVISDLQTEVTQLAANRDQLANEMADAIYQRDAEAQAKASALAERDAQAHLAAERQAALAAANTANDALQNQVYALKQKAQAATKAIADLQTERAQLATNRDQLANEMANAIAQRDAEAQAKASALAERDTHAQLAAERMLALEAAIVETQSAQRALQDQASAHVQQAQEACKAIAELHAERDKLCASRDQLDKDRADVVAQRDAEMQAKADLKERLHQLETQHLEDTFRQQLLQEEMVKAEAQIELIKDLLLREPSL